MLSPLLSNIMLNEFDEWLEGKYLNKKARKDRWAWNFRIKNKAPIAVRENRQWNPAISYCRYADDFVLIVKGTKRHAEGFREECRAFLEDKLCLTLNMNKTRVTHVDDGFIFLGHRIIRKRGPRNTIRPVTTIPKNKYRGFGIKLTKLLSGNYSENKIELVKSLNRKIAGWTNFYKFTDYTAYAYSKLDRIVFWKLAHWLGTKYKTSIKECAARGIQKPKGTQAKTWMVEGLNGRGQFERIFLQRFVTSSKGQFKWRNPETNPYIKREEIRSTITSRYDEVAMAVSHS